MDATEGWNDPANYSLFLPSDAFNLFGEFNIDFEFPNFLGPEFTEGNAAFQSIEWGTGAPDLENPSSMLTQPTELLTNQETPTLTSTEEPFRGQNSEIRSLTDSADDDGLKPNEKHGMNAKATKRKFLTAFSATSGEEVQLRTRRQFSEDRRQAVALNRMIGVCLHCRLRKVAAGPTEPISSGES
jgi:hypothetical protein